jgi:hypothetical protein
MLSTFKDILPILLVVITATLGLLTYAWQERLKRRTALSERRQTLYEQLIRNLVDLLIAKTGAERSKLITEIEKGWLFASDEVLYACYKFLGIYHNLCCPNPQTGVLTVEEVLAKVRSDVKTRQELAKSISAIFLAMRRDVRSDTKISASWAKQNFQIYPWGVISEIVNPKNTESKQPSPWLHC